MSLDRLINLAKKTGDRLIVHNPIDQHDVVIMDLDSYEGMLFGRRGIRPQSSGELLDEINRDIAKWRADQQIEEEWNRADQLEQEYWGVEDSSFGPETRRQEEDHWSKAGDILRDRYTDLDWEEDEDEDGDDYLDEMDDEIRVEDIPFGFDDEEDELAALDQEDQPEELQYFEPLPDTSGAHPAPTGAVHFDTAGQTTQVDFQMHEEDDVSEGTSLKKDPEEDDGVVFFEEPV